MKCRVRSSARNRNSPMLSRAFTMRNHELRIIMTRRHNVKPWEKYFCFLVHANVEFLIQS